jgi:hypothetical protein
LLAVADEDDSVEGLSHQHCHCLLSSVLFFFYSPFSLFFPYALPLFVFFFRLCVFCTMPFMELFFSRPGVHPFYGFYSRRMACVSLGNEDSGPLLQE